MKIVAGGFATTLKYISFIATLALGMSLAGHAAKAGELMDWLTGAGEGESKIEYPERGPLVVPPALKLPEPKSSASANNPAWPKDPDLERKRKAKDAAMAPSESASSNAKPLTLDEIHAGKKAGAGLVTDADMQWRDPSKPLSLQEMQALNEAVARKIQEQATVNAVAKGRTYLTDPPTVYRQRAVLTPEMEAQAAAAGQPVKEEKPWYKFW